MVSGFARFIVGLFLGVVIIVVTFIFSYIALKLMGVSV